MTAERAAGTFTAPAGLTVEAACEAWLAGKRIKPTTHSAYSAALAPIIEKYGDRPVQKIVKADVEKLAVELRDGTGPRGVWARTSINPMLARWRSERKDLQAQGILSRNVIDLVEPLRRPTGAPESKLADVLTEAEVEQLMDAHAVSAPAADADSKMVREIEHAHLGAVAERVHFSLCGSRELRPRIAHRLLGGVEVRVADGDRAVREVAGSRWPLRLHRRPPAPELCQSRYRCLSPSSDRRR